MNQKRIYFAFDLSSLSAGDYEGVCQLLNSQGKIVAMGQSTITASVAEGKAWCWYDFNGKTDQPGNWTFNFFVDGQKVGQKSLVVSVP